MRGELVGEGTTDATYVIGCSETKQYGHTEQKWRGIYDTI
jgi:hypothetical protein